MQRKTSSRTLPTSDNVIQNAAFDWSIQRYKEESNMAVKRIQDASTTRENMTEKSRNIKPMDKRTIVIAQEIKLAKVLAGNNKTLRDRALKRLKRWFEFRSRTTPFTEDDFMRIWKGLFYAMWMSDKSLFQEECAEIIASLVHLNTVDYSLMFFKCGLQTLGNEWFGIDQLRLDKFLMFVRRLLRQGLIILRHNEWNLKTIKKFNHVLSMTILNVAKAPPIGLVMHFTEIYLEELAKISEGKLKPNLLTEFINPFIKQLALLDDCRQIKCIEKNIFHHLMEQSDLGLEYEEKFNAWKKEGFPGGSIDAMQQEELPEDEEMSNENEEVQNSEINKNILDPRAGHVDVVLPQLKFVPKQIIEILNQNRFVSGSNSLSRKAITTAIDEFTQFSRGNYPLGMKRIEKFHKDGYSTKLKQATNRLVKFEKKLLNKDRKRGKRKLIDKIDEKKIKKQKVISNLDGTSCSAKDLERFIKVSEGSIKVHDRKEKSRKRKVPLDEFNHKKLKQKQKILVNENGSIKLCKKYNSLSDKGVKKKRSLNKPADKNYECAFERNSGTWFVYDDDSSSSSFTLDLSASKSSIDDIATKSNNMESVKPIKLNGDLNIDEKVEITRTKEEEPARKRITPVTISTDVSMPNLNASTPTQSPKKNNLFKSDEWDVPLKERETEIFTVSKSYRQKLKKLTDLDSHFQSNKTTPSKSLKRRSLDSQFMKNPFAKPTTPGSSKKVKIALNLNKAQDIREHVAQIKSSPGIPFDANKKPSKPLLKRRTMSPIDPFYQRKLNL